MHGASLHYVCILPCMHASRCHLTLTHVQLVFTMLVAEPRSSKCVCSSYQHVHAYIHTWFIHGAGSRPYSGETLNSPQAQQHTTAAAAAACMHECALTSGNPILPQEAKTDGPSRLGRWCSHSTPAQRCRYINSYQKAMSCMNACCAGTQTNPQVRAGATSRTVLLRWSDTQQQQQAPEYLNSTYGEQTETQLHMRTIRLQLCVGNVTCNKQF